MDIARAVLDWYDASARDLPWRIKGDLYVDPYRVWLSEIMLQQTTVATVKAYFEKFTSLWPTVMDLATADLDDVLKEWAGLGYYARARNLHKCAQTVAYNKGGQFPDTESGLLDLPGVGAYTAAAVAAIAFQKPAAVVDGNIERVYARLKDDHTPLPGLKKSVKEYVAHDVPTARPGDFAQGLMDIGATICTPRRPNCLICPLRPSCQAHSAGSAESLPNKARKKIKPTRRAVAFYVVAEGALLLERRPEKGLLGAMPGLPVGPWETRDTLPDTQDWLPHRPKLTGSKDADWVTLGPVARHTFTHFHLESQILVLRLAKKPDISGDPRSLYWWPEATIEEAGLPTVFAKMVKLAATA